MSQPNRADTPQGHSHKRTWWWAHAPSHRLYIKTPPNGGSGTQKAVTGSMPVTAFPKAVMSFNYEKHRRGGSGGATARPPKKPRKLTYMMM